MRESPIRLAGKGTLTPCFPVSLEMMQQEYGENIPRHNPHFIMGIMKAHPRTFIIIGILLSPIDPTELDKQGGLF